MNNFKQDQIDFLIKQNGELYEKMASIETVHDKFKEDRLQKLKRAEEVSHQLESFAEKSKSLESVIQKLKAESSIINV